MYNYSYQYSPAITYVVKLSSLRGYAIDCFFLGVITFKEQKLLIKLVQSLSLHELKDRNLQQLLLQISFF